MKYLLIAAVAVFLLLPASASARSFMDGNTARCVDVCQRGGTGATIILVPWPLPPVEAQPKAPWPNP